MTKLELQFVEVGDGLQVYNQPIERITQVDDISIITNKNSYTTKKELDSIKTIISIYDMAYIMVCD